MGRSEKKSKVRRKHRAIKRLEKQPKEIALLNKIIEHRNDTNLVNSKISEKSKFLFGFVFFLIFALKNKINKIYIYFLIQDEQMLVDTQPSPYNSRTKLDKNGNYPPWFNQRAIKKIKKINDRAKKTKKAKQNK
jgi:hypothetical protein